MSLELISNSHFATHEVEQGLPGLSARFFVVAYGRVISRSDKNGVYEFDQTYRMDAG